MKGKSLQTCLTNKISRELFDGYFIDVNIEENCHDISPEFLFSMAARKNLKRGFLFVSRVLGKHVPVPPYIAMLSGALLGAEYFKKNGGSYGEISKITDLFRKYEDTFINEMIFKNRNVNELITNINEDAKKVYEYISAHKINLKEKTLFIGFAETATGLGHSVFELFKGNAGFVHTTREYLNEIDSNIDFQEEHSHATEHFIYADISGYEKIVLVDDELTTGKTALNFIKAIKNQTQTRKYAVISYLDWRGAEHLQRFEEFQKEEGVEIITASLIKGTIKTAGEIDEAHVLSNTEATNNRETDNRAVIKKIYLNNNLFGRKEYTSYNSLGKKNMNYYMNETGRFIIDGEIDSSLVEKTAEIIKNAAGESINEKADLFLGTGEFIHLPMKIAAYFTNALFHSTTRSPIFPDNKDGYGIRTGVSFENPYDSGIMNYFYNISAGLYGRIFIFMERDAEESEMESMYKALDKIGVPNVFLIIFSHKKEMGEEQFYVY